IKEGSVISVTLSSGPPRVPVPTVVGMTERVAAVRLRAAGMKTGEVSAQYSLAPEGTIIEQTPKEGRARWGSAIDYVLSRGPETLQIPNVYEMSAARARKSLEAAGFAVKLVDSYSDEVHEGKVVSTDPAAATSAFEGTEIKVYVSIGPEFKELTMPDLRGVDVGRATAKLEGLGLRARVFQSCGGGGTMVTETDPVAGVTVRENDVVALFVC
ncbi:MAG: PASTA domain-containing protein, partial [Actinomycetota bacterium]